MGKSIAFGISVVVRLRVNYEVSAKLLSVALPTRITTPTHPKATQIPFNTAQKPSMTVSHRRNIVALFSRPFACIICQALCFAFSPAFLRFGLVLFHTLQVGIWILVLSLKLSYELAKFACNCTLRAFYWYLWSWNCFLKTPFKVCNNIFHTKIWSPLQRLLLGSLIGVFFIWRKFNMFTYFGTNLSYQG